MKHSNLAVCGRFRLLVRGEQGNPGISFTDKSWHTVPHTFVEPLESENVDVPFGRAFDIAHAHRYVINSFKFHHIIRFGFLEGLLDSYTTRSHLPNYFLLLSIYLYYTRLL